MARFGYAPPNKSFERTARQRTSHQSCAVSLRQSLAGGQPLNSGVGLLTSWRRCVGNHMKVIILLFVLVLSGGQVQAQKRLPIIDLHMHARTADHYGPPPLPICAPVGRTPRWDQRKPMWQDDSPPDAANRCYRRLLTPSC